MKSFLLLSFMLFIGAQLWALPETSVDVTTIENQTDNISVISSDTSDVNTGVNAIGDIDVKSSEIKNANSDVSSEALGNSKINTGIEIENSSVASSKITNANTEIGRAHV